MGWDLSSGRWARVLSRAYWHVKWLPNCRFYWRTLIILIYFKIDSLEGPTNALIQEEVKAWDCGFKNKIINSNVEHDVLNDTLTDIGRSTVCVAWKGCQDTQHTIFWNFRAMFGTWDIVAPLISHDAGIPFPAWCKQHDGFKCTHLPFSPSFLHLALGTFHTNTKQVLIASCWAIKPWH